MALIMILFPLAMAAVAAMTPSNHWRPWLVPVTAAGHLLLVAVALARPEVTQGSAWLVLDPLSRIILLQVSLLFLFCSFHTVGYLRYRQELSNRVFCSCLLTMLGAMSLVIWSHHLGLMWVAMEATTLATAPLIYFNRTQQSIEATWKYLLVGSVGIAMALFGTFFLAYASLHEGLDSMLLLEGLLRQAPRMSKPWLQAAFVLLLVGYGTKMGLAPMHKWKPDAYGEAPSVVGALLAGGVTSCAFLAILRIQHICHLAGEDPFTSPLLLTMGLFSMVVACLFLIGQRDFRRMLAYSSIEHMGILVLGLGIGRTALFGTMLHVLANGLTKGVLFLSAGNIHRAYRSKSTEVVFGAMRRLPLSGALFLAAFLAITGSPPFAPFISEFSIFNGALDAGRYVIGGTFLFLLLVIFIGMSQTVLRVVQGRAPHETANAEYCDGWLTGAPMVLLMLLVLALGLYIPAPLRAMLTDAARFLEGRP